MHMLGEAYTMQWLKTCLRVLWKPVGFSLSVLYVHVIRRYWLVSSVVIALVLGKLLSSLGSWLVLVAVIIMFIVFMWKWVIEPYFIRVREAFA